MSEQERSLTLKNVLVAAGSFDPSAPTTSIEFAPGRVVSVPTSLLLESLHFQQPAQQPASPEREADPMAGDAGMITIPVIAEEMVVTKRVVPLETVRLTTTTEQVMESAEVDLMRERWEVTRVPMDLEVDRRTEVRVEGETSIYPVFEERLVARKALFLSEEIHVRKISETKHETVEVELRRDVVTVERNAQ